QNMQALVEYVIKKVIENSCLLKGLQLEGKRGDNRPPTASINQKFYSAILIELDLECVFDRILDMLKNEYIPYATSLLLRQTIGKVANLYWSVSEREVNVTRLIDLLKHDKLLQVTCELKQLATILKYSNYP